MQIHTPGVDSVRCEYLKPVLQYLSVRQRPVSTWQKIVQGETNVAEKSRKMYTYENGNKGMIRRIRESRRMRIREIRRIRENVRIRDSRRILLREIRRISESRRRSPILQPVSSFPVLGQACVNLLGISRTSRSDTGVTTSGAEVTHKGSDKPCSSDAPNRLHSSTVFNKTGPVAYSDVVLNTALMG